MGKLECLSTFNIGQSHLDRLKNIVAANQEDVIKETDLEMFLNSFSGDEKKLQEFKDGLNMLILAIDSRILDQLANSNSVNHPELPPVVEKTYATKELCDILNVSKQTVVYWIKSNWLVADQGMDGGKYHIKQSEIVKFLNKEGKKYLKAWNTHIAQP